MSKSKAPEKSVPETRTKLLEAAMRVIRMQGFTATTVDDICTAAGVTKGSFFHYFKSKDDLAVAAAQYFSDMAQGLFSQAPFTRLPDPLERVLGYVDFRRSILQGETWDYTCLLGTMVQEAYDTHPSIRAACEMHITGHAAWVARDIEAARALYVPDAPWTAQSLALHTQAVLQGALILAKATGGPAVAVDSLGHLRRYIEMLFAQAKRQ
jgi:TetR/AcrR family transcriptional repressor of nem operon